MSFDNACPGAKRILEPSPEDFRCRKCGTRVEIWSDEMTAECPQCKSTVSREKEASCLDWCASAEQCLGVMKYNKLVRSGMINRSEPPGKDAGSVSKNKKKQSKDRP